MMKSFVLSGKIEVTPLPLILEELRQSKATGTLAVSAGKVKKAVYVKEGQIIFATSTDGHDLLGEILVKAGKLSRENLETALNLVKKSGGFKKMGALLVENGFVSPKDLFAALKTQVKNIIYSLFLWHEADYSFDAKLPPDVIHLQINMQELIKEIIQRIKSEA